MPSGIGIKYTARLIKIIELFSGCIDRFSQIEPKLIFSINAVVDNGKVHDHMSKLTPVVQGECCSSVSTDTRDTND